jgi:hypothetical protein
MRIAHRTYGCTPTKRRIADARLKLLFAARLRWIPRLNTMGAGLALHPVRTGLGVDAFVGKAQPLNRLATYKMLFHNGYGVFRAHVSVPDCFGINHHGWAMLALVEAAGFIDPHRVSQPCSFGQLLKLRMQFALAVGRAGWTRSALRAHIMADKNVVLKWGQSLLLLPSEYRLHRRNLSTIDSPGQAVSERMCD